MNLELRNTINCFLSGDLEYNYFCDLFLDETLDFFQDQIKSSNFNVFLEFYTKSYLFFSKIEKTNINYNYFLKEEQRKFKEMKKLKKYMSSNMKKFRSKILCMDFIYKHILTLNYVFFDELPKKYSFIFDSYNLILETLLDKIFGGKIDEFIIEKILKPTENIENYFDKKTLVKKLIKKNFVQEGKTNLNIDYEMKGLWPLNTNNTPMIFLGKDSVTHSYMFRDNNNKTIFIKSSY